MYGPARLLPQSSWQQQNERAVATGYYDTTSIQESEEALFAACAHHGFTSLEIYAALRNVTCPTLIIGGSDDRVVDALCLERYHRAVLGSQLLIRPGCGHYPFVDDPGWFFTAVERFISESKTPRKRCCS